MALRFSGFVIRGELDNRRRNSVHGWLELRGMDGPFVFDLTGNCDPDLAGKRIRFEARPSRDQAEEPPEDFFKGIAWRQIGPTGMMTAARRVRVADCPVEELYIRSKLGEPPPTEWKRCLTLEWYGQNGRAIIELAEPVIEFLNADGEPDRDAALPPLPEEPDEDDAPRTGLGITRIQVDEEGRAEVEDLSWTEDEADRHDEDLYNVAPDDLERQFEAEASEVDRAVLGDEDTSDAIRELELMDDLIECSDGEPLSVALGKRPLPAVDELDDRQVEHLLKVLLAELALYGVALDMCEHFTPRDAYRLLVEQLRTEDRFHPELRGTGWVQHFSTWESCDECKAEMDREFEEEERRQGKPPEDPAGG